MTTLTNNAARSRYEYAVDDDEVAFAIYREEPGAIVITHTETPQRLRGRGHGERMVRAVLGDIRARGLKVVPRCPFVRHVIAAHPEFRDLVR
ncbi:MAG TPA: GNAT family N-acetyltransferase [Xanthobacteraceae bacterium]|nr:GNAT family N-acetyltransferase [Xanthobacteraceae bacterium]